MQISKRIIQSGIDNLGAACGRYTTITTSGLNNQKIALFGLSEICKLFKVRPLLPKKMVDFTPALIPKPSPSIPLSEVFEVERVSKFFDFKFPQLAKTLDPKACFQIGVDKIKSEAFEPGVANNETAEFFSSFSPSPLLQSYIERYRMQLPDRYCGLQLRIESDWLAHLKRKNLEVGRSENIDVIVDPDEIFRKIRRQDDLDWVEDIVIFCDEEALTITKKEVRDIAKRFDFCARFKSDIVDPGELRSPIQKSVVDFQIGISANAYVGLSLSTFSSMLCLVASYKAASRPQHFIFDAPSQKVEQRQDSGRSLVAKSIYLGHHIPDGY